MNQRLFWLLVAGTIPGALVGYMFEKIHRENAGAIRLPIATAMIAVGLLMWSRTISPGSTRARSQHVT